MKKYILLVSLLFIPIICYPFGFITGGSFSTTTANYAANSGLLNNQEASYYTNASNLDAGTVPNARLNTTYTQMTGLSVNGTVTSSIIASTTGNITNLSTTTGTITNLSSTSGTINSLIAPTLTSTTLGTITNLISTSGTINSLVAPTLTSTSGTITNLSSTTATASTFVSTTSTITNLNSTSGTINSLVAPTLSGTTGTITNLTATNATSSVLVISSSATIPVLSSGVSVNGTVTANWISLTDKVYGEIASSYNATATIIAAQNTYYTVTANNFEVISKNATISTSNGTITVLKTGKYWVAGRVSGLSGNVNDVIHLGISINGANPLGYYECEFTLLSASGKGGQSFGGIISLNANDTVSSKIENITAANNVTIKFYNLSLFRILD